METARLDKLRRHLAERQLEAILLSRPENIYYLSGFDGEDGYLLITPKEVILAADSRYTEQVRTQAPTCRLLRINNDSQDWLPRLTAGLEAGWLGFEAGHITLAEYHRLTSILKETQPRLEPVPAEGLVESLRVIKDAGEVKLITKASAIADSALEHISSVLQPGMTEIAAAWEIEKFMRENGSEALPFEIIVAAGTNSALPHTHPSSRPIQSGEPIVIDIGAKCGHYASDLSRTLCLGTPDDIFPKVYDTVARAQRAALENIRAGMTGEEADSLARQVITVAGYGEAFGHSLGHGVGLVVHEEPRLGPHSTDKLADGMIFTIEPGIYLAGWGGVRIEDLCIMESGQARTISKARKDPA